MTPLPKTLNRPQVIALYSLAMELGPDCEFVILIQYTIGNILIEARSILGTAQYTLHVAGGYTMVEPIRKEA
jgi:hypothetical protein